MKAVFKGARDVFDAIGRKVTQYEPGKEIAPGITAVATPGHTPGHASHIIASGNDKVYVQADVTHVPFVHVRNPGWHVILRSGPARWRKQRAARSTTCWSAEKMMVQGFHYPFPSLAYVEKSGDGYREVMVPWNPTM